MKADTDRGDRRSWGAAALIAAVMVVGLVLLFRGPERAREPKESPTVEAGVSMGLTRLDPAAGDALLVEEATLFDPTPMFLPTEWNVSHNTLPVSVMRDIGRAFEDYPPRLGFNEIGLGLDFPATVEVPAKVTEVLPMLGRQQPYSGLGRTDPVIAPLPMRGARVDVISAKDGSQALSLVVPVEQLDRNVWQPLEFLLAVDAAGLIGPPVLMAQSSDEQSNRFFQDLLAKILRLGDRLPPGVYQVCVGP